MKTIKKQYIILAPVEKVWRALVDPKLMEAWGAGPALMSDQPGTKFSLWGGDIHGTNLEVEEEEKLVQDWFSGKWPEPSRVTLSLIPEDDGTKVDLLHERVPDDEADEISDGWDSYYLGAIKSYLENQIALE